MVLLALLCRKARLMLSVVICFNFNFLLTTVKFTNREPPTGILFKKEGTV